MWRLFHDSPARRDTYITINQSDQFPLMFCQTRWVEEVPVATRALEFWSFVVAVVEHFQALPSSWLPLNNKSYNILVKHHKDNSIKFKFQFSIDIANILAPFLKQSKQMIQCAIYGWNGSFNKSSLNENIPCMISS